ncbi:MAG: MaoC family dehydratase [Acidimicrobiia bacterium]|nr:MaoC family dehydratase [Acidimicrobiia bacterium]
MEIDQDRINAFADATLDHQYIHVDVERAATTPFGATIAHGFLTLSLMVHLTEGLTPEIPGAVMGINYGFDKIRFLNPVAVGSRIRLTGTVSNIELKAENRYLATYDCTVEIEGEERPALIARWLAMVVTA